MKNTRSEDGGQGRTLCVRREAGLTLDSHRSRGYSREARREAHSSLDPLISTR